MTGTSDPGGAGVSPGDHGPRAARLHRHGEPLVVEAVPPPEPGDDEVVVTMAFGGVNPVDRYIAAGRVAPDAPVPRILGMEGAGHLDGGAVLVQGHGLATARDGVWAGQVAVPRAAVIDVPDGVDLAEAAAMGVAGATAWRTASELAGVTGEDRVLVLGASGGVGSMLVSLCASRGARVWGQTGSKGKAEWIRARGAEEVVVGDASGLVAGVARLAPTVVFDCLGDGYTGASLEALEPFGRLVSYGVSAGPTGELNFQTLYRKGLTVFGYGGLADTPERLDAGKRAALAALAAGDLRVEVAERLPLDNVNEAFALLEKRAVTGKLVLDLCS